MRLRLFFAPDSSHFMLTLRLGMSCDLCLRANSLEDAVLRWILVVCIAVGAPVAWAQMSMGGPAGSMAENILRHTGSGTDLEPESGAPPMLMTMRQNGWMLMLHGEGSAVEQQQTGPRGHDKLFSVNWAMPMAQRSFGASNNFVDHCFFTSSQ